MCIAAPYTLTGAADTPAAREAACNAAKAGFKPPLEGMIQSLAGDSAFFSGAKGGVACMDTISAANAQGHAGVPNNADIDYLPITGYQGYYGYLGHTIIIATSAAALIKSRYKAGFLAAYAGLAPATVSEAAASAYYLAMKTYFSPWANSGNTPCGSNASCQVLIDDARNSGVLAARDAAATACDAAQTSSARLVCCNM